MRGIEIMGRKLGLSENLIESYKQGLKRRSKTPTGAPVLSFQFDLDTFQLLSAWWHQAILELVHTRGFQTDSRWIARRLGISVDDVNVALQRLLRLNLLEMTSSKRWVDKSGDAEFQTPLLPAAAAQQVDREVYELAIETSKQTSSDRQAHGHMVMAINSKRLPELRAAAEQFLNEIRSLVEEDNSRDEVYQVSVSFFPLSKS